MIFGLPTRIQTNRGSNLCSKCSNSCLQRLYAFKHVCSSAYHPQGQGALERIHLTLKVMLRTHCQDNKDWSKGIPLLHFVVGLCETVQESLGFSPFELAFEDEVFKVQGLLTLLKEKFVQEPIQEMNLLDYILQFMERLHETGK